MKPINVLSLFDGMSCGRIALERAGIPVNQYYASEIDKHAIKVSKTNWTDVVHIGDVTKVSYKDGVLHTENGDFNVSNIDLVIGGSPCQGFSFAGKQLNFDDTRSRLFFEFVRLLKETKAANFLLENVVMKQEYQNIITEHLGVAPVIINSSLVSAQNRKRLYWVSTVIDTLVDKCIVLGDIVDDNETNYRYVDKYKLVNCKHSLTYMQYDMHGKGHNSQSQRAYFLSGKHGCLDTKAQGTSKILLENNIVRHTSVAECEKLQTVPVGYTSSVSDSQRYKMLGNGWTVDIIAHILKGIKE